MHRIAYFFCFLMCLSGTLLCSCSTDTHYDSMMTRVTIDNLPESPYHAASVSTLHKITFDRDVASLKSMVLDNAWLSIDVGDADEDRLRIIKAASVILLDDRDGTEVPWLTMIENLRRRNEARFLDVNGGPPKAYVHDGQMTIRIDYELDPYLVLEYRQIYCRDKDLCPLELLLSMTFEMVDE